MKKASFLALLGKIFPEKLSGLSVKGGGVPPFPLRKKTFFFSDWFSVKRGGYPLNGRIPLKRKWQRPLYIVYSRCVCSKGALRHDSMPTLCGYSVFPVTEMCFYFPKSRSSLFLSFCQTKQTIKIIHQYVNYVIDCSSDNNFLLDNL